MVEETSACMDETSRILNENTFSLKSIADEVGEIKTSFEKDNLYLSEIVKDNQNNS